MAAKLLAAKVMAPELIAAELIVAALTSKVAAACSNQSSEGTSQ
jgi:hypothetical protein